MKTTNRKMVRIDEDLGKLIRVGRGLDFEDVLDIGMRNFTRAKTGSLRTMLKPI